MHKYFTILFFCLGYAFCLGAIADALVAIKQSINAANWPTVIGRVVSANLSEKIGGVKGGNGGFKVDVEYEYSVEGREYSNKVLAFGYRRNYSRTHRQVYEKLKSVERVDVHYDPNAPQRSVLSCGNLRTNQTQLASAIFFLLLLTGFNILMWLGSRGQKDGLLRNLITH